ncbi:MAG: DNA recombination protein RmuC [Demequinaceae bacterium]|nr:DNA recombination protein RmuC [Demequinaceae bacterium]
MTQALFAVGGFLIGAVVAYAVAVARSSARTEAVAERRAAEREARVRMEADQRIADIKESHLALKDELKALSADVLAQNTRQFLDMADERFKRTAVQHDAELAKREEAVKQMVEPVSKALDEVRRQTTEAERLRTEGQAALREQVIQMITASEKLDKKTTDFINTLRRSDVRGNWGEVQLRRIVELAGMVKFVDFDEQENVKDADGKNLRPDLTVKLAGGKTIVVDSKVALAALIEAFETDDEKVRAERLVAHARHVKKHIDDLAGKKYWEQFSAAPEFVVMFVPSEAFYQAAIEQDPALQEYAFSKNVVIATPTTLVAMLRTVAHAWREDALAKNAQAVLTTGRDLYDRLRTMGDHLARVGKAIEGAGNAYNDTVASFEKRVLVSARRFGELQEVAVELPEANPAAVQIRQIVAPDVEVSDATEPREDGPKD